MARSTTYVYSSDPFWVYGGEDVVGDDYELEGSVKGGNDVFYGEDETYGYEVYGDAYFIDGAKGGNDTFYGGEDVGSGNPLDVIMGGEDIAFFAGDARFMMGSAVGGNDVAIGGNNSGTALFGDAVSAYERSVMGNDQLTGGDAFVYGGEDLSTNLLIGDAYSFGSEGGPVRILEDDDGYAKAQVAGGNDVLQGGDAYAIYGEGYAINVMAGDAYSIAESSKGGADQVWGGSAQALDGYAAVINLMAGDALAIYDQGKGGNDRVAGGDASADDGDAYAVNLALGDAYAMGGDVRAGNDVVSGGDASSEDDGYAFAINLLVGDIMMAMGPVMLGNDKLTGGDGGGEEENAFALNAIYGDIGDIDGILDMLDLGEDIPDGRIDLGDLGDLLSRGGEEIPATPFRMGSDTIVGGSGSAANLLVGDAGVMYGGTRGGNDNITAGGAGSVNWMVGDADYMQEGSVGGRDILTAGAGEDHMWGDARYESDGVGGSDTFVLSKTAGVDYIYDFDVSEKDKINVKAFGLNFKSLQTRMEDSDGGVYIDLTFGETEAGVFIAGVSVEELTARCFVF